MAAGFDEARYYRRIAIVLSESVQRPDYGSVEIEEEEQPNDQEEGEEHE